MPPLTGKSTLGDAYSSVEEMWQKEVGDGKKEADKKPEWYTKGVDYWRDVPATVDGVLGVRTNVGAGRNWDRGWRAGGPLFRWHTLSSLKATASAAARPSRASPAPIRVSGLSPFPRRALETRRGSTSETPRCFSARRASTLAPNKPDQPPAPRSPLLSCFKSQFIQPTHKECHQRRRTRTGRPLHRRRADRRQGAPQSLWARRRRLRRGDRAHR